MAVFAYLVSPRWSVNAEAKNMFVLLISASFACIINEGIAKLHCYWFYHR